MKTSTKLLARDWRGGELSLLLAAIILATATITCIQLFSSRLQSSLFEQASEFLAADATIKSTQPIHTQIKDKANTLNINTANTTGFRAMLFTAQNSMQIAAVKGVDYTYPLKGSLTIFNGSHEVEVTNGPESGELWIAPRLFDALNANFGDIIYIGEHPFKLTATLLKEPDNAQSIFGIAPRAMINHDDIIKTGAVQVGSRINYTTAFSGDKKQIDALKRYVDQLNNPHYRWQTIRNANRSLGSALARAEQFLMLTATLGVLLCGLAIALAARRYATRQIPHAAMLKTFGLTPANINRIYIVNLFILGLIGATLGLVVGWGFHFIIIASLENLFTVTLAPAGTTPFIFSFLSGLCIFLSFSLAPMLSLKNVSPSSALRLDEHNNIPFKFTTWLPGFIFTLTFIYLYSANIMLSIILLAAVITCALGVAICSTGLLGIHKIYRRAAHNKQLITHTGLRLGLAGIFRHRKANSLQLFIFATLLMLLFTLTLIRTQLISQWQNQAPVGTPNHFVFNIFSEDKKALARLFSDKEINPSPFYPMTRGRLASVNNVKVEDIIQNKKTNQNYERELNLTWSRELGQDNKVTSGRWWIQPPNNKTMLVSAEERYAQGLDIKIGDTLVFSVSGEKVIAEVSSIRSVQWDSMNPNFYMIFDQPLLNGTSANWLTSFYLPQEKNAFITYLLQQYPTLSVIELDQVLKQVQTIIAQVTSAVEFLLILVLMAGVLVLFASIQASLDTRKQETAIIKTIGGDKKLINTMLLTEFVALGAIAGLLAASGAQLALYFLQTKFMNIEYQAVVSLMLIGPAIGAALIGLFGWLSTRNIANTPPIKILRELSNP